ncbi:hypothetical protein BVI1335_140003 [Burkholderia vietnamiensis]|nr:hypothetical protein BVI1335_140003 [Burkholderia vietnamiensis]
MRSASRTCSACHIARRLSRDAIVNVAGAGADFGPAEKVSEFIAGTSKDGIEDRTMVARRPPPARARRLHPRRPGARGATNARMCRT